MPMHTTIRQARGRGDARPGVRDDGRHGQDAAPHHARGPRVRLLQRWLQDEVRGRSRRSISRPPIPSAACRWIAPARRHMSKHEGARYYFCCEGCQKNFEANPDEVPERKAVRAAAEDRGGARTTTPRMAHDHGHHGHDHHGHDHGAPPVDPATVPQGTKWTCPMHPEIVKDGPGDCPICGMALEPMVASLDDGPNPELVDFTRRMWVSAALCAADPRHRHGCDGRPAGARLARRAAGQLG